MDCVICKQHLDEYFDQGLDSADYRRVQSHLEECAPCRAVYDEEKNLRDMLRSLPVTPANPGFSERVLKGAKREHRLRRGSRIGFSIGGALAAGLLILLLVGKPLWQAEQSLPTIMQEMTIAVNEPETVNLVVNVPRDLPGSTFIISLPAHVEMDGFPGQRQVSWTADLRQGRNLLALPIQAKNTGTTTLTARIEHGGQSKTLAVRVYIQQQITEEINPYLFTG